MTFHRINLQAAIWTAAWLLAAAAAPAQDRDTARLDAFVQSHVADGSFMGAVLMVEDGKTLLDKGYGSANQEWNVPNDPGTVFRIGSITKQFTAAAVFLLQERGKLDIDDPVRKYLPDAPTAWDGVTIYHLLTHTSGIPNFTELPDFATRRRGPTTPDRLIASVRGMPLDFPPGTKWNYSNTGYDVLGAAIEKVSGESYARFLEENIFKPLGLNETGYDTAGKLIKRRASGYVRGADGLRNAGYIDTDVLYAAGALHSTTHDLVKWERGLFGGKLLSAASLKKMTTPFIATSLTGTEYGCGLFIQRFDGHIGISHVGFLDGFNSELFHVPDKKLTVVVLGNVSGSKSMMLATALAKIALGEKGTPSSEMPVDK